MRLATLDRITLPNFSAILMMQILAELGSPPADALTEAGLNAAIVRDPTARLTGRQELALQHAFHARVADRPDIWVELGSRYRLLSYAHESSALASASAPTLRALIEFAFEAEDLNYTLAGARPVFEDGDMVGFETDVSEVPPTLRDFTVLRDIASTLPIFRDIGGDAFLPIRVETGLPPRLTALIPASLGTVFPIDRPGTRWLWRRGAADLPLPNANPLLFERGRSESRRIIGEALPEDGLAETIQRLIRDAAGLLAIEEAARALNLSVRTLQRRLAAQGHAYRDLIDDHRHGAALGLLHADRCPIAEIAWRTGYQNVTSFNHAFRRRTGMSPRAYRRLNGAAGATH